LFLAVTSQKGQIMPIEEGKDDLEAMRTKYPCKYCKGRKRGCRMCNYTGIKGISELAEILNARDKAIGLGYCPIHGRYQGTSCPHPSHQPLFGDE